jgi:hypothetical protein
MSRGHAAARERARVGRRHDPADLKLIRFVWLQLTEQKFDEDWNLEEAVKRLMGDEGYESKRKELLRLNPDKFFYKYPGDIKKVPDRLRPLVVLAIAREYAVRPVAGETFVCFPGNAGWTTNPGDYSSKPKYPKPMKNKEPLDLKNPEKKREERLEIAVNSGQHPIQPQLGTALKTQTAYHIQVVLYDPTATSALFIGRWKPGEGPEERIQTKDYGTIKIRGTEYSWAFRTGTKEEMEELMDNSKDPCIVRRIRIPGKNSSIEHPTSLLGSVLETDRSESEDLGILKTVLYGHLKNSEPVYEPRDVPHQNQNWVPSSMMGRFSL